jgi:hypothetical protein
MASDVGSYAAAQVRSSSGDRERETATLVLRTRACLERWEGTKALTFLSGPTHGNRSPECRSDRTVKRDDSSLPS